MVGYILPAYLFWGKNLLCLCGQLEIIGWQTNWVRYWRSERVSSNMQADGLSPRSDKNKEQPD